MNAHVTLTAADGHRLDSYRADPAGARRGSVVVVQEIFGVNHHIRSICDRLAAEGYSAVAPALFDRIERGFESGYSPDEIGIARDKFLKAPDWDGFLRDTAAAVDLLKNDGPVGVIGFCMGGSVAFLAATRLPGVAAAVCFYGGAIVRFADETPRCPTQMHFGATDQSIPLTDVETIKAKRPDCDIHVYPVAGHGFHCDERASYHPESSATAWRLTLEWLGRAMPAR
jgi:carboxymethylenebutenolidase